MKPKAPSRVKKVKAWAVVSARGGLIGYLPLQIYAREVDALDGLDRFAATAKIASQWKVVPVTITLPK